MTSTFLHVFGDHAEVVRDQDDRRAGPLLHLVHQLEDLGLNRDVERGRRLVGDQQLRVARERHRDHHALAHAAGKLVRVVAQPLLGRGMRTLSQHLDGAIARFALCREPRCRRTASAICSPIVSTGLSEVIGS